MRGRGPNATAVGGRPAFLPASRRLDHAGMVAPAATLPWQSLEQKGRGQFAEPRLSQTVSSAS